MELVRASWVGSLPLLVEGAMDEYEKWPSPSFVFASRHSYLNVVLNHLVEKLADVCVVPETMRFVKFYHNDKLIRWQYPLGALFDATCEQNAIPFKIVIKFSGGEPAIKYQPAIQSDFLHWFKQGMFLRFGSRLPFTEFREDDDTKLWTSVVNGNVDDYYEVLDKTHKYDVKGVPIRFLYRVPDDEYLFCKQLFVPNPSKESLEQLIATTFPTLDIQQQTFISQGVILPLEFPVSKLESLLYPDLFVYIAIL